MFWLFAALLIAAAVIWFFIRLNRKDPILVHSASTSNLLIYRERLDELKRDLTNGNLSATEFNEAKEELATALLNDLNTGQTTRSSVRQSPLVWLVGGCLVGLPLIALPVHYFLRAQIYFQEVPPGSSLELQKYFMEGDQNGLSLILAKTTRNSKFWEESAQVYLQTQRPDVAVQAFQHATALTDDVSAASLLGQAHATAMLQQGSLDGKPTELIQQALATDPSNPQVRIWLGLVNLQHGEYDQAINNWERVLQAFPTDSPQRSNIMAMIEQAKQQKIGKPVAATADTNNAPSATNSTPKAGTSSQLRVRVELSAKLLAQTQPTDTVFILARAASGPRMPLAIVRKQVKDLPVTITLDDSTAMSQELRLSAFNAVKVIARVSRSGEALPKPGDLFGEVGPIAVTSKTTKIEINQQVP